MSDPTYSPEHLTEVALRQVPPQQRPQMVQAYLESLLARLLRRPVPGLAERSLVHLGFDSFMAGELSYLIESDLGAIIPLADFFDGVSPAGLAGRILAAIDAPHSDPAQAAGEQTPEAQYPLSIGQQALWTLYQMAPDSAAYNLAYALRLKGSLETETLQAALQKLVARHPSLRTSFHLAGGQVVQKVQPGAEAAIAVIDAAAWEQPTLDQRLAAEAARPFDLERAPLWRFSLFTRGAQAPILLLVIHHSVTDFWSIAILIDELGKLIQGGEHTAALPLPQQQYSDYVRWQNELLESAEGEKLWAYWQTQLAGKLPALELPTDRPRPPIQTYSGATQSCTLDAVQTQKLKALSQAQGTTLFTTLLAAFQVLLHRYTGQDDIIVGAPTTGRSRACFSDLSGYFVNTIALRANLSGNPSFTQFLAQVRQTVLDGLRQQDYPFARLVDQLQPERDFSRSPVFQAMFAFQQPQRYAEEGMAALALNLDGNTVPIPGLPFDPVAITGQAAQFDLTLMGGEAQGKLLFALKYNTDLFDAASMARLLERWQTLLDDIAADPERPVSMLALIPPAERHQLLGEWSHSCESAIEPALSLHRLFEAQAERTPDAVAVICGEERLTYRELNRRANRLAHHLRSLGVGPEIRVGVYLERTTGLIVALLGLLKAGGVYVPLDPEYPLERLAYILSDAQVAVLLTTEILAYTLPASDAQVFHLDGPEAQLIAPKDENPVCLTSGENLAYVIYTSGSTGKPKGVMIAHTAIANHLLWRAGACPLAQTDRFLQLAALNFDVSIWEIFAPLSAGAALILPRPGGQKDPRYLIGLIDELQITALRMGPSFLRVFLEQVGGENCRSLQQVFCGGEVLTPELQDHFWSVLPTAKLYNQYGPTETCVAATLWPCRPDEGLPVVPIGRPVANTRIYVLDKFLQPTPSGIPGELHIGGLVLGRGYLGQPDRTAEAFIPDPFGRQEGARLYKTGDLVRYTPSGQLEFLGRLDHQVKIRGFRVELGEVEAILARHPAVSAVVVEAQSEFQQHLLFSPPVNKDRLVAYVVVDPLLTPSAGELRNFAKTQLPDYMLPSAFVFLEALPLTPNGKVDRKALPAADSIQSGLEGDYVPPRTHLEEVLAEIWRDLLGVERVGAYDSFFELGGNSLVAVQNIAQLQDVFETEQPLIALFFENPTIAGLAAALTEGSGNEGDADRIAETLRTIATMTDEEVEAMLMGLE
ncbi:MAG: amino acid adenylation domain-containing protein [Chloroflexota bacterium]